MQKIITLLEKIHMLMVKRTVDGVFNLSLGHVNSNDNPSICLKEREVNNITTKWDKSGNTFVAKGNLVVKEKNKKYPFAFKFNADYMILQEWFGANIRI